MIIKTFESGSSGNLHLIQDGNKKLMIECGVPMKKIMNYMDMDVSGCLLSHYHADHSKASKHVLKFGIDLFCTRETAEFLKLSGSRLKIIESDKGFDVDGFSCLSFRTNHDTPGSVGYLIDSGKNRVLFVTDTGSHPYCFPGITHIMIEANYSDDTIDKEDPRTHRTLKTHMSIQNVIKVLNDHNLSKLQEIHLIHLSDSNADGSDFKRQIQALTGLPVYVAEK